MILLILVYYISFWYRKKLAKITAKSKKKQDRCFRSSKTDVSDFKWVYQNVSNEVLSAWFKFQAKIPTRSGVLRRSDLNTSVPTTLLSKGEGLKDIGHNMNIWNLILVVNSVTVSYLICYNSLLQNATAILLQNAAEVYWKMRQFFYYKMRQLLQIATTLLKNATVVTKSDFITNCDSTIIYTTTEIFTFSLKLNHYYKDV